MCLIINRSIHRVLEPIHVNEDMYVWKILLWYPIFKKWETPYQSYTIDFKKGKCELPSFTFSEFKEIDAIDERKYGNGYHAYCDKYFANYAAGLTYGFRVPPIFAAKVFKCLVPKGSYVYYGQSMTEIACSSLTIIDEDYVPKNGMIIDIKCI